MGCILSSEATRSTSYERSYIYGVKDPPAIRCCSRMYIHSNFTIHVLVRLHTVLVLI
jgi:hypothetical protein